MPYTRIPGMTFRTQIDAKAHFSKILHGFKGKGRIPDPEHSQIYALLTCHSESADLLVKGADHFTVGVHPAHNTPCFCLHRSDGSWDYWSYRHCFKKERPPAKQWVGSACRLAVAEDVTTAKANKFRYAGPVYCEITKELLTFETCDLDHFEPKFDEILETWRAVRGYAIWDDVPLDESGDLLHPDIAADFRAYHRACDLQVRFLTPHANRSLARKGA